MRAVAVFLAAAAAATVLVAVVAPSPVGASQADLDKAQKAANQAAADYAAAETRLSRVETDIAGLEAKRTETRKELDVLGHALRSSAIAEYVRGRNAGPDVGDNLDLAAESRRATLVGFVTQETGDTVDKYRSVAADLDAAEAALADRRREATAATAQMKSRIAAAQTELGRLQKLEADRKAKEAAQQKADAARAAAAASSPGPSGGTTVSGSWLCPVAGAHAFSDDFGDPRAGGRKHQGNDILSPRGTPVVAPVSGNVRRHDNGAGGIAFYLDGDDGNQYYGAHLQSYAGITGHVEQGTVIGYVGNTGDAAGGPTHLHFEIHPGGGSAIDPYRTLRQYC